MISAPTGEMCFGRPLPSGTMEALVKDLGYRSPDGESDCYHKRLEIKKKDKMEDVTIFLETLRICGRDPALPFGRECQFRVPDEEQA